MSDTQIQQISPSRPPLYHYSDARGFLGILESKSLWFSNIRYMNDSEEWSYALKTLEKVIQEFDGIGSTHHLQDAFQTICSNETLHTHYTFSFSEKSDSLSQWRGYCPNGGYSFSIDDEHLNHLANSQGFILEKCIYEETAQREFILNRILKKRPEQLKGAFYSKGGPDYELHYTAYNNLIPNSRLLALIKHPSFKEEYEWRMIAGGGDLGYRESRKMIIPYLTVKIPLIESTLRVSKVVVGPTAHKELALNACRMMMYQHSCSDQDVNSSEVPYINW